MTLLNRSSTNSRRDADGAIDPTLDPPLMLYWVGNPSNEAFLRPKEHGSIPLGHGIGP